MSTTRVDDEEDVRIGVPLVARPTTPATPPIAPPQAAPRSETPPVAESQSAAPEIELRPGETELGRPPQTPHDAQPLSHAERAALVAAEAEEVRREVARLEEIIVTEPSFLRSWGIFGQPLLWSIVIGLACLLGLYLLQQTLQLLALLANQPPWMQYIGYAALGVLGIGVLIALGRLVVLYYRLRRNRQLEFRALIELSERTKLRWLAHAKTLEAKQRLEDYLREFPLTTPKERATLQNTGFTDELLLKLTTVRDELLDPSRFANPTQWFERFRDGFQSILDTAAAARVDYWAKRTGVVTAVSPNGLVDSLGTLFFSFSMLSDLCRIYNLRVGRTGTAFLLGRVFFNAYLAGQVNDLESMTEQQLEQLFSPSGALHDLFAAKLLSKVGSKVASGTLNYFLIGRLGKATMRLLRPIAS